MKKLQNNLKIESLINENIFKKVAHQKNIPIDEAYEFIKTLSFSSYCELLETMNEDDITPPSGQPIGPSGSTGPSAQPSANSTNNQPNNQSMSWNGKDPISNGMTVGLKNAQTGQMTPGVVTRIDNNAKGVMVKDPTTNQEQWQNMQNISPFEQNQEMQNENTELQRLKELAGIQETCSAGATGAGSVAAGATAIGQVKRRMPKPAEESGNGTVYGKIDPNAATGELSRRLADAGKKTASRKNCGKKAPK